MTAIFGHGQMRLYLLSLLAEREQHGYEMIRAISDRFGGTYRPSAGTVYPRLDKLAADGLIEREEDGRKAVFRITDAGREHLAAHADEVAEIEAAVAASVTDRANELRASVKDSMASLRAELAAAAEQARAQAGDALHAAADGAPTAYPRAREELRAIERELTEFRNDLRDAARRAADQGSLSDLAVTTVRTVIEQARASINAVLPPRR